jgi:hypothetical protein
MRATIAAGLVLSLVLVPLTPARAANPDWQVAPLPVKADPSSEVLTLFDIGMDRFHAADYDQALIMWKRAFVLLSHDFAAQDLRATLVVDIVVAHGRAYEVGHNPEHLVEAMRVIDLRKAEIDRVQAHDAARVTEMNDLDTRRAELARLHEVALSQGEQPTELADGTALQVEAPPPPTLTRKQLDAALAADRELGREFRRSKAMADAGFVLVMVGIGLVPTVFAMTAPFFLNPKDGEPEPMGVVIPVVSVVGVFGIVGGTLLGVGKARTNQIRQAYVGRF